MFAVIRTGGKQYRVSENARIEVERLPGNPGDAVTLDQVLMVGGQGAVPVVGAPLVEKAAVFAEVVEQTRGDKVLIFKKKRRKNHRRLRGHRQDLTVLKITGISTSGERPAASQADAEYASEVTPEAHGPANAPVDSEATSAAATPAEDEAAESDRGDETKA